MKAFIFSSSCPRFALAHNGRRRGSVAGGPDANGGRPTVGKSPSGDGLRYYHFCESGNNSPGKAAAEPLRFLDFLIHEPERAVLLHGAGVPVLVPQPERFAVHKLIVASRRKIDRMDTAKSEKDLLQSASIVEAAAQGGRLEDLAEAFTEACDRGKAWRSAISKSLRAYDETTKNGITGTLAEGVRMLGADPAKYGLAS